MANNYTSLKLSFDNASRFIKNFSANNQLPKYLFIGNSNSYANSDTEIPDVYDTLSGEKEIWNTMFAAKRITLNDLSLIVPRKNWSSGTKYKEYDDRNELSVLLSDSGNSQPMYVVSSNLGVYICLSNNISANSTVEPSGDYTTANGFIHNSSDGYTWKYLYSLYETNKYLTNEWLPVPTSVDELQYKTSQQNLIEGSLSKIVVTNSGTGYYNRNLSSLSYSSGTTSITLFDDPVGNIVTNMTVTGNGIPAGTYITNINYLTKVITLSLPTSNSGVGLLSFKTRVYIDGDGNQDYIVDADLVNTNVYSITVSTIGTGYSWANVLIYGTGTNAAARAVIAPKYGFGFNPARDLVARNVMITQKIGQIDSTEKGTISTDTSFRQYGILSTPHKYGENQSVEANSTNTVISQTTDLTLETGSNYILNEKVYQGTSNTDFFFTGIVHAQTEYITKLINVRGTPSVGSLLKGVSSGTSRAVSSYKNPTFQPYSGDILYAQNITKVQRSDGQAEDITIVVKF